MHFNIYDILNQTFQTIIFFAIATIYKVKLLQKFLQRNNIECG